MFRGFIMQVWRCFLVRTVARGGGFNHQGVLFGVSHAYQNPLGMLITGTLGVYSAFSSSCQGAIFGRQLSPTLVRCESLVLFYFQGRRPVSDCRSNDAAKK